MRREWWRGKRRENEKRAGCENGGDGRRMEREEIEKKEEDEKKEDEKGVNGKVKTSKMGGLNT